MNLESAPSQHLEEGERWLGRATMGGSGAVGGGGGEEGVVAKDACR